MTKLKKIVLASSLACVGFISANAIAADEPASPHTLTANVGLYSQYVFRGLAQTNEEAALQGGFDYAHSSGFYLGVWGSNISWLKENLTPTTGVVGGTYKSGGSLELDFYGGYKGSVGDFSYDVGLLQYYYPGDLHSPLTGYTVNGNKANTLEAYIAGSWKWFTVKYSQSISDKTFGVGKSSGTSYLDLSASFPIAETGLTLGAHYGLQTYKGTDPNNTPLYAAGLSNDDLFSYEDWKISLAYDMGKIGKTFNGMSVGVAYTDTSSATCAGYGKYSERCSLKGNLLPGAYPENIADGKATVWISKTF